MFILYDHVYNFNNSLFSLSSKRKESGTKENYVFKLCLTVVLSANKNRKYLFAVRKSYECRSIPSKAKRSSNSSSLHQRAELVEKTTSKNLIFPTSVIEYTHTHTYRKLYNNRCNKIRIKKIHHQWSSITTNYKKLLNFVKKFNRSRPKTFDNAFIALHAMIYEK